jgi:hypothetical protein
MSQKKTPVALITILLLFMTTMALTTLFAFLRPSGNMRVDIAKVVWLP